MRGYALVAAAACLSAASPLLPRASSTPSTATPWPERFEGRALTRVAAGPGDEMLARDFPGHVARFSDGRRQIVLRQVGRATRQLHPARVCFEMMGYRIEPLPMRPVEGGLASCFAAKRGDLALRVCEQINGADGSVHADVPSWYWPAVLGSSRGPWLAAMTVERTD